MRKLEVTNASPPVDDYGDDYGLRVKPVASSIVVVAVVVDRNDMKQLDVFGKRYEVPARSPC